MASSKVTRRVKRNHSRYRGRHGINVVPMIDMMVILVAFLVFTAVFTRTTILELNLPAANAEVPDLPQGLQLEVIVRDSGLEVADRSSGPLKQLPKVNGAYDFAGLSEYLLLVKSKYPDKQDATILMESEIPYDTLVQAMDTVRVYAKPGTAYTQGELFPDVSIGDAPGGA